jgi:hypothetical protein
LNDQEWELYLETLPPALAGLARRIHAHLRMTQERERLYWLDERQYLDRQIARMKEQLTSLHQTLDDLAGYLMDLDARTGGDGQATLKEREHGNGDRGD